MPSRSISNGTSAEISRCGMTAKRNGLMRIALAGLSMCESAALVWQKSSIPTTAENFGIIQVDKGQPESSGCGGIVFALSDGSNPVTFVVYGTQREIAQRICG